MKIFIAYDGSECSDAALDDLRMAGLPDNAEALVVTVAEVWLPPPPEGVSLSQYAQDLQSHPQPFRAWQKHAKEVSDAEALVQSAQARLRSNFPKWHVQAEATYGSSAWQILLKADEIDADLIVVGSHGRSALSRLFLGSISQKVLTEASCSVRVARGRIDVDPEPCRLVIGFDGSRGALMAVEAVAGRYWPNESKVKLVAVTDVFFGADMAMTPAISLPDNGDWVRSIADDSIKILRKAGLETEFVSEIGNPKNVLVDLAEEWHADAIFVGANRWGSRVERFLLGSVSAAVAARAHCSVEVVRRNNTEMEK